MFDLCRGLDHRLSRRRMFYSATQAAAFLLATRRGDGAETVGRAAVRNTAKTCIFIHLVGAPSQLDTFDPKDGPWNPADADIRQYGPGFFLSRTLFPNLSRNTGDLCLLHSVNSWELAHERGVFYVQTAHPNNPAFVAESPHMGAVLAAEKGPAGLLPPFMSLNTATLMQGSKFLGGVYEPMLAPASAGGLTTLEHNFYGAQSRQRFDEKYTLLSELDAELRNAPPSKGMADHASFYDAARKLMYDAAIAAVFRFNNDENQQYGNSNVGRAALVARNAVRARAGVQFINIHMDGWDTHQSMYDTGYRGNMYDLCGQLDTAVGSVVTDLKASGEFASTMIVIMGEFGRTPGLLNPRGGRDHHKAAMSVAMLGGGVKGGRAIGRTDSEGDQVIEPGWSADRPIYMEDITATIYSALGVDWTKSISDTPSGRRFEYVPYSDRGRFQPVDEVFG